jgi:glyoxylase-like metal-dependent hydrolase (beta-lactamase superfamily II)
VSDRLAPTPTGGPPDGDLGHPLAARLGIVPLSLPTPFAIGPVTAWLLTGDGPLTLVDTGPASAGTLHALERRLADHGRRVEDLEAIVLTHEHADHVGLAAILAERSGARVVAIDALAGRLADPAGYGERETAFMAATLERQGLTRELTMTLGGMQLSQIGWAGGPVATSDPIASGQVRTLGGLDFELVLRPGHSVTDTLLIDHEHGVVLGGDHLLANVSSNPLLACPPELLDPRRPAPPTAGDREPALTHYLDGLRRTAALDPAVVLGGHGPAVTDVRTAVDDRLRLHERRKRKILRLLGDEGRSAFAVARRMWGDVAWKQPLLCVSEVVGHLDLLRADGAAAPTQDADGVERWCPTG